MRVLLAVMTIATVGAAAIVAWSAIGEWNRREELALGSRLYAENCAGCHGKNLEGQPDWMKRLPSGRLPAPPHDGSGHTWHHSDSQLFLITKDGMTAIDPDYESDMPAFRDLLTDDDIEAILAFIKSTWPEREGAYQAARTEAERAK
jgi:mono/diheme cytochrome c family protein